MHYFSRRFVPGYLGCLFLAALLSTSGTLHARNYLVFEGLSYHAKNSDERNALNLGLGYESSPSRRFGWQAGAFRDSFNQPAFYAGVNYAFGQFNLLGRPARFIPSLSIMRKKFTKDRFVHTRVVPLPVLEICLADRLVMNVSGSPELDYDDNARTNGVMFFQLKMLLEDTAPHC